MNDFLAQPAHGICSASPAQGFLAFNTGRGVFPFIALATTGAMGASDPTVLVLYPRRADPNEFLQLRRDDGITGVLVMIDPEDG